MNNVPKSTVTPTKRRCTVTVSAQAWHGSKAAAQAAGCGSISELLEKLGNGELAVVAADEVGPLVDDDRSSLDDGQSGLFSTEMPNDQGATTWPLDAVGPRAGDPRAGDPRAGDPRAGDPRVGGEQRPSLLPGFFFGRLPKMMMTATCAALILLPILYVIDLRLSGPKKATVDLDNAIALKTGDTIAGYEVTDHMRIRPVHPVTGAINVPHNGVDVATPSGTPVYAVGVAGDQVSVDCWWDVDGGGWVADQTTESYPQLVFQSLHLLENECRSGTFTSGEVIALTGNSGLGSGEHYDFRVKLDGRYIDPPKQFLEAALTGKTLSLDGKLAEL
ncbi:MAG: hypothetical protein KTR27_08335 [Leptolyngbyaceae cyanobacterium MAG.088]|nr:hypothetical protein [Leptolyngbyaceae cyanobacterium MAG.088]